MKKILSAFIVGVLMSAGVSVYANEVIKSATYNDVKVSFNGNVITLEEDLISVQKEDSDNTTNYMPVREVLEGMGFDVNESSNMIEISNKTDNDTGSNDSSTSNRVDDEWVNIYNINKIIQKSGIGIYSDNIGTSDVGIIDLDTMVSSSIVILAEYSAETHPHIVRKIGNSVTIHKDNLINDLIEKGIEISNKTDNDTGSNDSSTSNTVDDEWVNIRNINDIIQESGIGIYSDVIGTSDVGIIDLNTMGVILAEYSAETHPHIVRKIGNSVTIHKDNLINDLIEKGIEISNKTDNDTGSNDSSTSNTVDDEWVNIRNINDIIQESGIGIYSDVIGKSSVGIIDLNTMVSSSIVILAEYSAETHPHIVRKIGNVVTVHKDNLINDLIEKGILQN